MHRCIIHRTTQFTGACALAAFAIFGDRDEITNHKASDNYEVESKQPLKSVLKLGEDNFHETIKKNKYVFVKFYAPWCGHCKTLAPEYEKAAEMLANLKSEIVLAEVDATEEEDLAAQFQLRGYPTLLLFRDGKHVDYLGARKALDIVTWLLMKSGPTAKNIANIQEAEEFAAFSEVVALGLFEDLNSKAAKEFLAAAEEFDDIPFGISDSKEVMKKYGMSENSSVVLLKHFDDPKVTFNGDINTVAISSFVARESQPLVVQLSHDNAQKIFGGELKNFVLLFLGSTHEETAKITAAAREAARELRDKVGFVSIDTDDESVAQVTSQFDIGMNELPTMRLIELKENAMIKYKPQSSDLTAEAMKTFVKKLLDGEAQPFYLSEEIPDDWDEKPVKVLVGKSFNSVVFDKSKDVLVEIYAPWCGHCVKLAPIYEQVAEEYAHLDSLVIAKMDASVNELPNIKIPHFPIIKLFKKDTNEVVDYQGGHSFEGLVEFLEEQIGAGDKANDSFEREEL